jgi:hypothetical protein
VTVVPFPSPFDAPAFASRVILFPARASASLTVGLPATGGRTWTGFPRSACMRHARIGRPLYPGDDGAHPATPRSVAGIRRFPAASP